jgi:hypothetical protein
MRCQRCPPWRFWSKARKKAYDRGDSALGVCDDHWKAGGGPSPEAYLKRTGFSASKCQSYDEKGTITLTCLGSVAPLLSTLKIPTEWCCLCGAEVPGRRTSSVFAGMFINRINRAQFLEYSEVLGALSRGEKYELFFSICGQCADEEGRHAPSLATQLELWCISCGKATPLFAITFSFRKTSERSYDWTTLHCALKNRFTREFWRRHWFSASHNVHVAS